MSALNQKTINKSIKFDGIGLHTGEKVRIKINPAKPNSGIIFKRIDLPKNNIVLPGIYNVSDATLCTTLSNEYGVKISTVEHLMAAFYGLGIDNAEVEINSQELPILDGSSKEFVKSILNVGFNESSTPIKLIKIEKKIEVREGSKFISIDKSKMSLDIDFEIKYPNQIINTQRNKINMFQDDLNEIFNARTFCLFEDVEKLKKMGLAKGGSLQNAIVVENNKVLNTEGLRNSKEFVNHKILDCMGDLYLSGYKIIGSVLCSQGGHSLTNKILRKVFNDKSNFSIFELKEKTLPHSIISKSYLKSIA